jgi:hypothetical protein
LQGGVVDPDFIYELSTTITLREGITVVEPSDDYPIEYDTDPSGITTSTTNGRLVFAPEKLLNVSVVKCIAKYMGKDYYKNLYIHKTTNAYELVPDKHILVRDPITGKLIDNTVTVEVKK